ADDPVLAGPVAHAAMAVDTDTLAAQDLARRPEVLDGDAVPLVERDVEVHGEEDGGAGALDALQLLVRGLRVELAATGAAHRVGVRRPAELPYERRIQRVGLVVGDLLRGGGLALHPRFTRRTDVADGA